MTLSPTLRLLSASLVVLFALPASAQSSSAKNEYHQLYGDGLRHYAEGHYDKALENLYRAWALVQSPMLLKLIVRSHDFMGHCTAAERQLDFFSEVYPRERRPNLQLCDSSGELAIECSPHAGEVVINHTIKVACGSTIALPPGLHTIRSPRLNQEQTFEVVTERKVVARLELKPEKWVRSRAQASADSIVIQTPDGDVRIWLESNLRRDPDMHRESPGFSIIGDDRPQLRRLQIPSLSP